MVRITKAIDPLMMVPDNSSDLTIVIDLGEDAFPNRRVLLHLSTLFKRQGSGFLE